MFQIESCQSSRSKLTNCPRKGMSAQIPREIAAPQASKSFEMIPGMILNQSQQKFAAKSKENEMQCLKAIQRPALTGQAFDSKIYRAICS